MTRQFELGLLAAAFFAAAVVAKLVGWEFTSPVLFALSGYATGRALR